MKNTCILLGMGVFALSCSGGKKPFKNRTTQPPNIIFILSDDHAYQAISCYGSELIETPHIDRLASEGMRFERCFVTNSICAPSRATILTGTHSHINGKIDNRSPFDTTNITFPQLLNENGYQTAMFGKLHFGNNPRGFNEFRILPGQGHYYNPDFITPDGDTTVEGYVTDIITDFTLEWLENSREKDRPFMLAFWHKAPHCEWMPAPEDVGRLVGKGFPVPETYFDSCRGRSSAARSQEMSVLHDMTYSHDFKISPDSTRKLGIPPADKPWLDRFYFEIRERMTPDQLRQWDHVYNRVTSEFMMRYPEMSDNALYLWKYQRFMEDYLGTIESLDRNIGRLLDYLETSDLKDNTVVIYTSDQGLFLGEHGWFDKRFMYEEAFRTPLIIRWPGHVRPGTVSNHLVQNLDFAQTILEMAGIEAPGTMQGKSMVPILEGSETGWRDAVYYHYYEYPGGHSIKRHFGIRTDRYKLIRFYDDIDAWEMYDLEKDPMELSNIYSENDYRSIRDSMKIRLKALQEEYRDPIRWQYQEVDE